MVRVMSFNTTEEMLERMQQAETEANAKVTASQMMLEPGDYVLRVDPEAEQFQLIIGQTMDAAEYVKTEREATSALEPFDERAVLADFEQLWARGYMYGRWYSTSCPEGEWGSTHITHLHPCEPEVFQALLGMIQTEDE